MKKKCAACGKQIPSVALDCVFCSTRQPMGDDAAAATELGNVTVAGGANVANPAQPLLGMPTGEMNAVVASSLNEQAGDGIPHGEKQNGEAHNGEAAAAGMPHSAKLTGVMAAVAAPGTAKEANVDTPAAPVGAPAVPIGAGGGAVREGRYVRPRSPEEIDAQPFFGLARTVMGVGGLVLVALFFLPWHGVSSWQLLETLSGADFVRQLFYLTGGIVLVATAILPLSFTFRAAIGAMVAATPVVLGAGGMMEGWRGVVAALAILGLPASHLLRAHAKSSTAARGLVAAAIAAVVILYLVPISSVVPIVGVLGMVFSGEIGAAVMGVFVLIPLVFAGLSLLGLMGRDLTDVGVLLSLLSLLWAPVVVALRGLLVDDGTQLYIALALLWASATAALSLAQLLSLAASDRASA